MQTASAPCREVVLVNPCSSSPRAEHGPHVTHKLRRPSTASAESRRARPQHGVASATAIELNGPWSDRKLRRLSRIEEMRLHSPEIWGLSPSAVRGLEVIWRPGVPKAFCLKAGWGSVVHDTEADIGRREVELAVRIGGHPQDGYLVLLFHASRSQLRATSLVPRPSLFLSSGLSLSFSPHAITPTCQRPKYSRYAAMSSFLCQPLKHLPNRPRTVGYPSTRCRCPDTR